MKWLSSPHDPTQGPLGPVTSTFSRNFLSKLIRMCSGYVRGSHPLPHGCDGSSKAPRELCNPLQPPPRAFRGAASRKLPLCCAAGPWKEKKWPQSPKVHFQTAPGLEQTVAADWREEGGRMTPQKKQWPLWILRENTHSSNYKANQVWQILMGAFLWTCRVNLGFPITELVQNTHSGLYTGSSSNT